MRRPGLTLMETLFTMAIFSLMMATLSGILLAGKSNWMVSRSITEAQQSLSYVIEERVAYELQRSTQSSLTVVENASHSAFSFLSARGATQELVTDSSGRPTWQAYVVYSLSKSTGRLYRRQISTSATTAMASSQLATEAGQSGGKLVAVGVSSLGLTHPSGSRTACLTIEARCQGPSGKWTRLSRQVTVLMWN